MEGKERSALLNLLSSWFASGRPLSAIYQSKLLKMIKTDLSLHSHWIKTGALKVLGNGTHVLSAQDRSLANNIMTMINRHTKNQGKNGMAYIRILKKALKFLQMPVCS